MSMNVNMFLCLCQCFQSSHKTVWNDLRTLAGDVTGLQFLHLQKDSNQR